MSTRKKENRTLNSGVVVACQVQQGIQSPPSNPLHPISLLLTLITTRPKAAITTISPFAVRWSNQCSFIIDSDCLLALRNRAFLYIISIFFSFNHTVQKPYATVRSIKSNIGLVGLPNVNTRRSVDNNGRLVLPRLRGNSGGTGGCGDGEHDVAGLGLGDHLGGKGDCPLRKR